MLLVCLGAFAQCIAHTIVPCKVAIAHEGEDFRHMKALVLAVSALGFWSLTSPHPQLSSVPFISLYVGPKPRNHYTLLSASSTAKMRHVLC